MSSLDLFLYKFEQEDGIDENGENKTETRAYFWKRFSENDEGKKNFLFRTKFFSFSYYTFPQIVDEEYENLEIVKLVQDIFEQNNLPVKVKKVEARLFGEYQEDADSPAILLVANGSKDLAKANTLLNRGIETGHRKLKGKMHEAGVSNGRKLTALLGIEEYSWYSFPEGSLPEPKNIISKDFIAEYIVEWEVLKDRNVAGKGWTYNPKIAAFDIEAFKPSKRRGMPDPEEELNYAFMVSFAISRPRTFDKDKVYYQLSLGGVDQERIQENVNLYLFDTEKELLLEFLNIMTNENFDIICGFNSSSWDFSYLNQRLIMNGINWPENYGHLLNSSPEMVSFEWNSQNQGVNRISYAKTSGLVTLDLHKYFKRNHPEMERHKLQSAAMLTLGRGKFDMSQKEMVTIFENYWRSRNRLGSEKREDVFKVIRSDLKKNDPSVKGIPKSILRDFTRVAEYNMEDSVLVLDMMVVGGIFDEIVSEMVSTEVPMEDLHTKGMQLREYSLIYSEAKRNKDEKIIITRMDPNPDIEPKGGEVGDVIPGFHTDVISIDITSQYPSILLKYNVCPTTYVPEEKIENYSSRDLYEMDYELLSGEVGKIHFVKQEIRIGIYPRIISRLLKKRKELKEELLTLTDKFLRSGMMAMIQAIKIDMNSLPGMMAVRERSAKLPFPEAAAAIFTKGRQVIKEMREEVIRSGGEVLALDTDGMLLNFPELSRKTVLGDPLSPEYLLPKSISLVNKLNKKFDPLEVKLENTGIVFIRTKKNYIFWPYGENGRLVHEDMIIYKGVQVVRRDSCQFVCRSMTNITKAIMAGVEPEDVWTIALNDTVKLLKNEVSPDQLVVANKVGDNYKQKSAFINVFANRLREGGESVKSGDVLEYVIVRFPEEDVDNEEVLQENFDSLTLKNKEKILKKVETKKKRNLANIWGKNKVLLGKKAITPDEYYETLSSNIGPKIDRRYYLNRLASCIDGMFETRANQTADQMTEADLESKGITTESSLCVSQNPIAEILTKLKEGKITIEKLEELSEERLKKVAERVQEKDKSAIIVNSLIITDNKEELDSEEIE